MRCFECEDCPFTSPDVPSDLYEIHLTVDKSTNYLEFQEACSTYGAKVHLLKMGTDIFDLMLTYRYKGSANDAEIKAYQIEDYLKNSGFNVIRTKIETTLKNELAAYAASSMGTYYETHLNIKKDGFRKFNHPNLHISESIRNTNNNSDTLILTLRGYDVKQCEHLMDVYSVENILFNNGALVVKKMSEFVFHDTNPMHDVEWLRL